MSIKFTDIRPQFTGSEGYVCPNECLLSLREVLKSMPWKPSVGGSIASGGEVPLTVILPHVDSLKIVDHNYISLWWTCFKILMIKHRTNAQIRELFAGPLKDFSALINDLKAEIPINAPATNEEHLRWYWGTGATLKVYWTDQITDAHLDAARERLDEVEVIHGDLRDLSNIDLLYISNALEHTPHDSKADLRNDLHKVLIPGGMILRSDALDQTNKITKTFSLPKGVSTVGLGWHYGLARTVIHNKVATERLQDNDQASSTAHEARV